MWFIQYQELDWVERLYLGTFENKPLDRDRGYGRGFATGGRKQGRSRRDRPTCDLTIGRPIFLLFRVCSFFLYSVWRGLSIPIPFQGVWEHRFYWAYH